LHGDDRVLASEINLNRDGGTVIVTTVVFVMRIISQSDPLIVDFSETL
jgi:hypothetical protein